MDPSKKFPTTVAQWANQAVQEGVRDKPIHEEELHSASKITWRQFLLLRVIWKAYPGSMLNTNRLDIETWMSHARQLLQSYNSWKLYKESFRNKQGEEGTFFLARVCQLDAAKVTSNEVSNDVVFSPVSKHTRQSSRERREKLNETPTKPKLPPIGKLNLEETKDPVTPSTGGGDSVFSAPISTGRSLGPEELRGEMYPKVDDEQLVNIALVNFLKAITDHFPFLASTWTIHRKPLKAKFDGAEYEARTDGYLRGKADGEVRALIEVKAPLRAGSRAEIRMQESAQLVAWLKDSPSIPRRLPFRRFHVSQDRHEIWLSFAEYDQNYIDYIESGSRKPGSPEPMLTMHEYGPFNTLKEHHMAQLGPILLALTLRADHDRREEQANL